MPAQRIRIVGRIRTIVAPMPFRRARLVVGHVRAARPQRRAHRRANVTLERGGGHLVHAPFVVAQMSMLVEDLVAVRALMHAGRRRRFGVHAQMVLELFGVLERLVAARALEVAFAGVDALMRVQQASTNRRLEVAQRTTVQFHVARVHAPQMRVQCVPRAKVVGRGRAVGARDVVFGGAVTALVVEQQIGAFE